MPDWRAVVLGILPRQQPKKTKAEEQGMQMSCLTKYQVRTGIHAVTKVRN